MRIRSNLQLVRIRASSTYFSSMYYKSRYCDVRVHTKLEREFGILKYEGNKLLLFWKVATKYVLCLYLNNLWAMGENRY
jgi:hypothetical protein